MTREEVDSETFDDEISSTGSTSLTVQTGRATELVVYIDDGTTGGAPPSYTLQVDAEHDEYGFMRQDTISTSSDNYHEFTSNGKRMKVTVESETDTSAERRVLVKSYRSMD